VNGLPEIAAVSAWLPQDLIQNLHALALVVSGMLITVCAVQNLTYTLQLFLAGYGLARRSLVESEDTLWWYYSDVILPVSLLVPAYNEQSCIVESVTSLLRLRYPLFEVIVINDGSTDGTLDRLVEALGLELGERIYEDALPHAPVRGIYTSPAHPNLVVLDKENGGKADALNAGINVARRPLIASLDADSMLEPDSLLRVVQPFISRPEHMIAVGGTVRVINGCTVREGRIVDVGLPRSLLAQLQIIEYLRAFLMGRLGWSELNALPLVAGAFAVMRRAAVIEAGGYERGTVGEDFELIMRLHRLMRDKVRITRSASCRSRCVGPRCQATCIRLLDSASVGSAARWRPSVDTQACCSSGATGASVRSASGTA
jgi:cellulose synthase/poly-beta-1,6-N-acetylglucosamine synthase-like glycosyltransferase